GRLRFLNPDKVIPEIQGIVTKFENYYHLDLSNKFKLSLYMHIALMLERLMLKKDDASEIKSKAITSNEKEFYQVAKKIFHPIEVKYNITVNDYELSLIFELFKANSRYKNA
ncbi:MAG: PRD domain-containing protein, partial [Lactobacillus sp.]|nr:PRD domain-containing protein [Lactobacillus sp.]